MSKADDAQSQCTTKGEHPPSSSRQSQISDWRWVLKVFLVILWVFVALGAYFWAHKPLSPDTLASPTRTVFCLAVWLLVLIVAAGVGRRAAGSLLQNEGVVVRLSISTGLGLGMLSLVTLALGVVGWLTPLAAWILLALAAAAGWRHISVSWRDLGRFRLPPAEGSRFQKWVLIYAVICLGLTFLLALAPPTGWDSLVYHLTEPRLFADAGRLTHTLDIPYLGFPQLGEMLFTLGMLLAGDGIAALIHFAYGLSAICLTAALTQRFFGGRSGWFAGLLLLSVPTLLSLMSRAYVDLGLMFYAVATLYAFLRWQEGAVEEHNPGWLMLAGVFAGLSAGVKYTAIAIPIGLGLATLWASRRAGFRTVALRLLTVVFTTSVVALPWLLENWLTTGNPVYPFFFGGRFWDGWRSWWYDRPGTGLAATAPWRLLTAPLEATVLGVEGGTAYDATIGPLILVSIPLLGAVWSRLSRAERSRLGYTLIFFGVCYLLWLVGLARSALLFQSRLLLPAFGAAAVLGGVALDRLSLLRRPQLAIDWLIRVAIAIALALLLYTQVGQFAQANPLPVLLGQESSHDYLARRLGAYQLVMDTLMTLPPGSNVVFLWEPRSYGCLTSGGESLQAGQSITCQPDALLDRFLHLTYLYSNADAIAEYWRSQGITHILLFEEGKQIILTAGFDPITPRDLVILSELETYHLQPIVKWNEAYTLYELRR